MPAPGTYYDITTLPYSQTVTQADFAAGTFSGGTANEVGFRRVVSSIEALGNFTDNGGTFLPVIRLYESDGSTLIKTINPSGSASHGWYHILPAGTYFVRITRSGGGASDFDFQADFDHETNVDTLAFDDGDVLIQDQRQDYPALIYGLDGTRKGFVTAIPAGQTGSIIHSGRSLWHDLAGSYSPSGRLHLFDTELGYVTSANASLESGQAAPMSNSETDFYVVDQRGRGVSKVDTSGTVTSLGAVGASGQVCAIGVNADGTVLYWAHESGASSGVIHRYDLLAQSALADFYTVPGFDTANDSLARTDNLNPGDILVLPDDSIVTWWYDASGDQYFILHINSSGTLINSFPLSAVTQRMDHLAYVKDSTTEV